MVSAVINGHYYYFWGEAIESILPLLSANSMTLAMEACYLICKTSKSSAPKEVLNIKTPSTEVPPVNASSFISLYILKFNFTNLPNSSYYRQERVGLSMRVTQLGAMA